MYKKTKKRINNFLLLFFLLLGNYSNAQSNVSIELSIGALVENSNAGADSVYKATVMIAINDSIKIEASVMRIVVIENAILVTDKQVELNTIDTVNNGNSWKENEIYFFSVANYNPLVVRKYLVEVLNANGQLIIQFEKEI